MVDCVNLASAEDHFTIVQAIRNSEYIAKWVICLLASKVCLYSIWGHEHNIIHIGAKKESNRQQQSRETFFLIMKSLHPQQQF